MNQTTAWEPIPVPKEGTCGSCKYLDTSVGYPTYPMQYRCMKNDELHFEFSECDVPAFIEAVE